MDEFPTEAEIVKYGEVRKKSMSIPVKDANSRPKLSIMKKPGNQRPKIYNQAPEESNNGIPEVQIEFADIDNAHKPPVN